TQGPACVYLHLPQAIKCITWRKAPVPARNSQELYFFPFSTPTLTTQREWENVQTRCLPKFAHETISPRPREDLEGTSGGIR
ncbi:unnamed protein product, partial [Nesidiocoris tenuis]